MGCGRSRSRSPIPVPIPSAALDPAVDGRCHAGVVGAGDTYRSDDGCRRLIPVLLFLVVVSGLEAFEFLDGIDDFRDVQERVALEPDVNKGGLHAGQDFGDPALVDIADNAALPFALDENLDDLVVLENGDPCFQVAGGDDHLLVHGQNSELVRPRAASPRARARPADPP